MGRIPTRIRAAVVVLTVALAGGIVTSDAEAYTNGHLPAHAVAPINTGVKCDPLGGQLANRAAAAYNTFALAEGQRLPINGCVSAYRTYAQQDYLYHHCPAVCAFPGTSNHGLGHAVDVPPDVQALMRSHGATFDWAKIEAPTEPWHWNYVGGFTRPNPGTSLTYPRLARGSGGPGQAEFVRNLQQLLRGVGRHVTVDGDFGPKTTHALRHFQRSRGQKDTGAVRRRTWIALKVVAGRHHPPEPPTPAHHHHRHRHLRTLQGVDVSQFQPNVDWSKAAHDGTDFAIFKTSEGADFHDPSGTAGRLNAIRHAGITAGTYHFMRPQPGRSGAVEGRFYAHTLRQLGIGSGDIRPFFDLEVTQLNPAGTCTYLHRAIKAVRNRLHVSAGVYTFPSFAKTYLSGCGKWLTRKVLWIANPGVDQPDIAPWGGYAIWQYTFTGHLDGVPGQVDLDRLPGGRPALNHLTLGKP
jgi:GH25 family lysozyme M1 (1,4-beta-N-acetylmuramidase)